MKIQIRRKKEPQIKLFQKKSSSKKETSWQEAVKLPWERSEALYHTYGNGIRSSRPDRVLQQALTGLQEVKKGEDAPERMRESFRAENSYGNIALGVNKKKEAAVVVSQKREHNAPVTKGAEKTLRMERKKREIMPEGSFYMNPDLRQQGAVAFQAKLSLPAAKMAGQIRRYYAQTGSRMLEKRMPHLCLERERGQLRQLGEGRRKSLETGESVQTQWYDVRIRQMKSRMQKQEQDGKQMMKQLRDAWQKAGKVSAASAFSVSFHPPLQAGQSVSAAQTGEEAGAAQAGEEAGAAQAEVQEPEGFFSGCDVQKPVT